MPLAHRIQVREIHESAYRHQREVESGERTVVGVNRYQAPTPPIEKLQTIDAQETRNQLDRLARVKRERDARSVQSTLRRLKDVAKGSENTVPAILECVEAYATLGEICNTLRDVFGEHTPSDRMTSLVE